MTIQIDFHASCLISYVLGANSQPIVQWIMGARCSDTGTWKVICHSLDIDLIHGDILNRWCTKKTQQY